MRSIKNLTLEFLYYNYFNIINSLDKL